MRLIFRRNILAGVTSSFIKSLADNQLLIAVTEKNSEKDLENFVKELCCFFSVDETKHITILKSCLKNYSKSLFENPLKKIKILNPIQNIKL